MERNGSRQNFFKRAAPLIYPVYLSAARAIRSHRWLMRVLFKVKLPKHCAGKISWDFTTLVLKRALRKRLNRLNRLERMKRPEPRGSSQTPNQPAMLEIGIGQAALLCIYLARTYGLSPDGIDIVPQRVELSKEIARFNNITLDLRQSDLFENIDHNKKYDFIFWNSSYIPTGFGNRHHLTGRKDVGDARAWDGGEDGTETITRFLSRAPGFLRPGGEVLLGVNRFYVPDQTMTRIIDDSPLALNTRVCSPFNPSAVYVLTGHGNEAQEK